MTVSFGVAGIPLTCKGRTLKDSIDDVHALELEYMEVQLLRFPIFQKDDLFKLGILSKELEVGLSVHSPYYMDILGSKNAQKRSIGNIKGSLKIAKLLQGNEVVTHLGLYNDMPKSKALKKVIEHATELVDYIKDKNIECRLGFETSGRKKIFGSLDEILMIVDEVPECIPIINFGHIHAREEGILRKKRAFQEIFNEVRAVTNNTDFYTNFSGVIHQDGNKIMDTPIKKSDIKFDALAKCLLDNPDYNTKIISSSPLLEHDAQYMKLVYERYFERKIRKQMREKEQKKKLAQKKKDEKTKGKKDKDKDKKTEEKPKKKTAKKILKKED